MDKKQDVCGIYQILNICNNCCYIGESIHCYQRWKQHRSKLRKNKHGNTHLQNAWNKYGEESFRFRLIEICNPLCSQEELAQKEIGWIAYFDSFKNGYNQSGGGEGTSLVRFSPERNAKLSKALKGRKLPHMTGENSAASRPIVCINNKEWFATIRLAAQKYYVSDTSILRSCQKHWFATEYKLVFMYEEDYLCCSEQDLEKILYQAEVREQRKWLDVSKSVICLNNGDIVDSCVVAAQKYNTDKSYIHKCCKGQVATAGKDDKGNALTWLYLKDYKNVKPSDIQSKIEQAIKITKQYKRKQIMCLNTGMRFESAAAAARYYGLSQITLTRHLYSDKICGIEPYTKSPLRWEILN